MNRLLLTFAVFLVGCATFSPPSVVDCSPAESVTRAETLAIAESYRVIRWTPSAANAFHGKDAQGIRVDTPDVLLPAGITDRPGWWMPNHSNTGMPYMWGGFDTPETFTAKVREGRYAGDVYTHEKRALLDNGVSQFTCGIDCSGLISRCWRLDRSYSTRELPSLCTELSSYDELLPVDILNKLNEHALLFVRFLDRGRTEFMAYETGSPPTWKVLRHPTSVAYVKGLGYRPYRYKHIE